MEQNYEKYESNKKELGKYFRALDKRCKELVGPHTSFQYPVKNPFRTYKDVEAFNNTIEPYKKPDKNYLVKQNVCRFGIYKDAAIDESNRFYKGVKTEDYCRKIKGKWSPGSTNRENKYEKGVCWVSDISQTCGDQLSDNAMLRPYHAKYDAHFQKRLSNESNRCTEVPNCSFQQQSAHTFDCVPSPNITDKQKGEVMIPPKDMPLRDFERFLEAWYGEKIKDQPPPQTMKLLGEGDRCRRAKEEPKENAAAAAASTSTHSDKIYNYYSLNPFKSPDSDILKAKLGSKDFDSLVKYWKRKDTSTVSSILSRLEYDEFEKDEKLSEIKENIEHKNVPSVPQSIINMVMKNIALKGGKNRGLLAWHSVGSGKTNTATGVIDAFWDDDRRIIFASSLDALASNPDWKFHQLAQMYFPRFKDMSLELIGEMFAKRGVKFYSFAKLSNRVHKAQELIKSNKKAKIPNNDEFVDLDNSIVIIDEVHNLFRPLPTQQKQHEYLEARLIDPRKHPGLKIVILTATPGDNIDSVVKLLNMVRDSQAPAIKIPNIDKANELKEFKSQIRGLVSFFDMSYDTTRFPVVYDTEPIKLPMSKLQFQKYVEAYKTVTEIQKNFDKLAKNNQVYKYWAPARKYANMLFNFEKDMNLNDFSSKMPALFGNIKKYHNEKHYVYSAFYTSHGYGGQGILAIAKELEKKGYKKLSVSDALPLNRRGKLPAPGKRYILAANSELGDDSKKSGDNLAELLKIYNHPANKRGDYIHVMLASQGFNEGIDLKAVRHIHFFEPLITMASDNQTIGRASRSCSHGDLDRSKGEWIVKIHRYMSEKPTMDKAILNLSQTDLTLKMADYDYAKREVSLLKDKVRIAKKQKNDKEAAEYDRQFMMSTREMNDLADDIKKLKENLKESKTANVPMIEETIFKESRERMRELMVIYKCMQEAAFDCRLLKEFHEKTKGQSITCEF